MWINIRKNNLPFYREKLQALQCVVDLLVKITEDCCNWLFVLRHLSTAPLTKHANTGNYRKPSVTVTTEHRDKSVTQQ